MAKCVRLALSKLAQSCNKLSIADSSLLRLNTCQSALNRRFSAAIASPHLRRDAPTLRLTTTKSCTWAPRRLLQTEVDKELIKFLEKEIEFEESTAGKTTDVKGVDGFEVSLNDADVTLTSKSGNESVVVKFSINASVDAEGPLQGGQESEAEMVSRPPFSVELSKGDGLTLSLQCMFTSLEEVDRQEGPQDAEAIVDGFEIQEVALHRGEWKETVYSVSADIMDGNLYDLMMDMLDERGINDEFAHHLIDFSTSYEHKRYLEFLKSLKSFVEK